MTAKIEAALWYARVAVETTFYLTVFVVGTIGMLLAYPILSDFMDDD